MFNIVSEFIKPSNVVAFDDRSSRLFMVHIVCFKCSQRVLYSYRKEDQDGDGEPDPQPIPGSFSGRVPQIVELVTVSSNVIWILPSHWIYATNLICQISWLCWNSQCKHYILALVQRNQIGCAQKPFTVVWVRNFIKWNLIAGHRTPHYRKTKENGGKYQRNVVSQRGCPFHGRKG